MGAYYYAAGERIELDPDDTHIAVDQRAAEEAGLDTEIKAAGAAVRRVGPGVLIAERSALDDETVAKLREAGALRRVYRRERGMLVPLPEVRIETDNAQQRKAVMRVLAEPGLPQHTISEDDDDRMIVRPASGDSDDALELANRVYERAHPAASSVRFLQFVPKRLEA